MSGPFLPLAMMILGLSLLMGRLAAQDGPFWEGSRLTGSGGEPTALRGERVFSEVAMKSPTELHLYPLGDQEGYLVVELGGKIFSFLPTSPTVRTFLLTADQGRFYSIVFDPGYPAKPYVYLAANLASHPDAPKAERGRRNRISRFTLSTLDPPVANPESELVIIEWASAGHDGCDLEFGRDGFLYATSGDGAAPGDPDNVGQLTDNLLGSILRLDVSEASAERPYQVPADNPFVGEQGIRPEVWAYGLRNPWKMTMHPASGDLLLGDNGDEHWELVRYVAAGTNHGWSTYEGSHPFRPSNPMGGPVKDLTLPVAEHSHQEMRSVIGGVFYRGEALPELRGHYFYGCYFMRNLWAFPWDPEKGERTGTPRRMADLGSTVVDFCVRSHGEILVLGHDGQVHQLVRASQEKLPPIPPTLSQTGLFSSTNGGSLQPVDGVISYVIAADSWSDGMRKQRHLGVPAHGDRIDARAGEAQHKSWRFPPGTAVAQTFRGAEDNQPVETQVMHKDGYSWKYLTYRWRADGSDAELVPAEGMIDEQTGHRFAARSECASCHTQKTFFLLATGTQQMSNTIPEFNERSWFRKNREPRIEQFPELADPYDEELDLEDRARSYLHVNCAHCHREAGLGGRAQFQLLDWLSLEEAGLLGTAPMIPLGGGEDRLLLAPGEPERSEIYLRMTTSEAGRMPLLGCQEIDAKGAELIRDWIESLPVR